MNLKLLDLKSKPLYDTKEEKNCKITSIVDYSRSMQYKIYIVYGYGPSETIVEEFILKINADKFCERFKDPIQIRVKKELESMENAKTETPKDINLTRISPKEVIEHNIKTQASTNFERMQNILLETMEGLTTGLVKPEQAKSISNVAQTLINSVKIEADLNRGRGDKSKPKFLL